MAKGGKLTKLKSVLKKLNSFNKQSRSSGRSIAATVDDSSSPSYSGDLHPVYVGKSRRRYFISSDVMDHPVFRELAERSSESDTISIACEVVLFEHLLWMLENADPQPESLDELVEFYACWWWLLLNFQCHRRRLLDDNWRWNNSASPLLNSWSWKSSHQLLTGK